MHHHLSRIARKFILIFWIISLISIFGYYLTHKDSFRVENIRLFLEQFWSLLLFVYFLISALRGLTLIPSTPFVVVWAVLFPGDLLFVYIISLFGILLSVSMIYFFSQEMGFEEVLMKKYPKTVKKAENWIQKHGFIAVSVTSFLLFIPTDVVSYMAGTLRMNYLKFIAWVMVGEWLVWGVIFFSGPVILDKLIQSL